MEEWRDVPGWEGSYQVSNLARVRSLNRMVRRSDGVVFFCKGIILKQYIDERGYPYIAFSDKAHKRYKKRRIHQLVGTSFVSGYKTGLQINHKNGIKTDNGISNLEWVTGSQNIAHAHKIGLLNLRGENHPGGSKLTEKDVLVIIDQPRMKGSGLRLAKQFGVSRSTISAIRHKKSWKHLW